LEAVLCEIYTDVDGVYSADPNIVPTARKLDEVAFEEMLELAASGAKVLQMRSVELAMKKRLEICVRSSFSDASGTLIKDINMNETMEGPVVTGLSHDLRQAKVSITGLAGIPESLTTALEPLAQDDICVDFITQNVGTDGRMSLSFTIDEKMLDQAIGSLRSHLNQGRFPDLRIAVDKNLAKVSAVGIGMRAHAGVAYRFFSALIRQGIPISMALSTEIRVSCLIPMDDCERAVQALHSEFFDAAGI
jgi:aspartate kinase